MTRRPAIKPRKTAIQERSRQTVDVLIEATARILVKDGYEKASTNKIALAAGVSIGSLYQYFPSKEALVAAVIDRHMQEILELARKELIEVALRPIDVAVRRLVAVMIEAHRVDPKLHRVLIEQTPRTVLLENIEVMERETYRLVRAYLEAHRDALVVTDLDTATFICVKTIEALTHAAVLGDSPMLRDERVAHFTDEVTRLIVRYLCG